MIESLREKFNEQFTTEKYLKCLQDLEGIHKGDLDFRVAETPVFVPADFTNKMLNACEDIIEVINSRGFNEMTERSIPLKYNVPGNDGPPECLVFDFGVCKNSSGELEPQLIEMQGFPSLFAYQVVHSDVSADYCNLPENFSAYLNGYDKSSFIELLKDIIIGNSKPENVILLEVYPDKQKTRIDFRYTKDFLGIETVCITELKADGRELYYNRNGKKIKVERIYNRVIFDDLDQQKEMPEIIDLKQEYDVKWVPHPDWFYRISKFTLPFIDNPYVPETFFLDEIKEPLPLAEYVLKPLFSFAGMGVIIDVKQEDIDKIKDPENWILQKKVEYADVVKTPDVPAKAEIRLFYFWKKGWPKPLAALNLGRLSKGKMIGTRYNKDKTWVGGTIAFFEKNK